MEEEQPDKIIVCYRYERCDHHNTWRCDYCVKNLNRTQTSDYFEPCKNNTMTMDWMDFGEK